jgi:hypothetical protein
MSRRSETPLSPVREAVDGPETPHPRVVTPSGFSSHPNRRLSAGSTDSEGLPLPGQWASHAADRQLDAQCRTYKAGELGQKVVQASTRLCGPITCAPQSH